MQFCNKAPQLIIQCLRRVSFVTSTIKTYRWVITDFSEIILSICNKHLFIERIRSIIRIGKPEVLPYHHSVLVARLVELLIACHTHPVTDHSEVHICVVSNSYVVFTCAIVEVDLREAPVTAVGDESSAIYENIKNAAFHRICHLTDTALDLLHIRYLSISHKSHLHIIKMRLSIALRPPQLRIVKSYRSHFHILCLTGCQDHITAEGKRTIFHLYCTGSLRLIVICQGDCRLDVGI